MAGKTTSWSLLRALVALSGLTSVACDDIDTDHVGFAVIAGVVVDSVEAPVAEASVTALGVHSRCDFLRSGAPVASAVSGVEGDFVLDIAEFLGPTGGGCTLVEVVNGEAVEEFSVVTQFSEERPDTTDVVLQLGVEAGI